MGGDSRVGWSFYNLPFSTISRRAAFFAQIIMIRALLGRRGDGGDGEGGDEEDELLRYPDYDSEEPDDEDSEENGIHHHMYNSTE